MILKISNIQYDTDGEDIDLPETLKMTLPSNLSDSEYNELASDYISDTTGWCHTGFSLSVDDTRQQIIDHANEVAKKGMAMGNGYDPDEPITDLNSALAVLIEETLPHDSELTGEQIFDFLEEM
jgi:hypothetical protein